MMNARQIRPTARTGFRACALACALAMPAGLLMTAAPAHAQRVERIVTGHVVGKGGEPVSGAVVHLKDTRSLAQRSYITSQDGTFRFGQLSTNTDYEVWADANGDKTKPRTVSSFDSKNNFDFTLKMTK